jgi:hypothetical protein
MKHYHTIFMFGWPRCGFHKKRTGTHYAQLVFLHPVKSAAHVVHSSGSRARNVIALFFMLGCDRYKFDKKHGGTSYAELVFLHPVGSVGHIGHSGASRALNVTVLLLMLGWIDTDLRKNVLVQVSPNLCLSVWWDI